MQLRVVRVVKIAVSVAMLSALLVACGETSGSDVTPKQTAADVAEFVCIKSGSGATDGGCGFLRPPTGTLDGQTAYKLSTVAGDSFWLVLPEELTTGDVVAIPSAPIRPDSGTAPRISLSGAEPRDVAQRHCGDMSGCRPEAVAQKSLPNEGQLARWADAGGTIRDFGLTTVRLGDWTLALADGTDAVAESIATGLAWEIDGDGFIRLSSSDEQTAVDRDWAEVFVFVPDPTRQDYYNMIEVLPGCEISKKQPNLGATDATATLEFHEPDTVPGGRWCESEKFWVDVSWATDNRVRNLYDKVQIVAAE